MTRWLLLTQTLTNHKSQLNTAVEAATVQRSAKQTELHHKNQAIATLDGQIAGKQQESTAAQQQLTTAEQSYQAAEEQVRQAEHRVHRARNCILGRRKRGLGSFFKKIINAPCHAGGNVDGEKRVRTEAQNHRNAMQQQRDAAVQAVVSLTAQRNQLVAEKSATEGVVNALNQNIETLRLQGVRAAEVQEFMAQVVVHVTELQTPAVSLQRLLARLQDMEVLLVPLEAVADRVVAYTGDTGDAGTFIALKAVIRSSVVTLKEKLPLYPLLQWFLEKKY